MRDELAKHPPKSLMHKASNYFLNEWDGIEAIASHGDVARDNSQYFSLYKLQASVKKYMPAFAGIYF